MQRNTMGQGRSREVIAALSQWRAAGSVVHSVDGDVIATAVSELLKDGYGPIQDQHAVGQMLDTEKSLNRGGILKDMTEEVYFLENIR